MELASLTCVEPALPLAAVASTIPLAGLLPLSPVWIWVFRETTVLGKVSFASELRGSAAFLILTLVLDLMHYLVGAVQFSCRLDAIEHEVNEAIRQGNE
jgi:hypothetical protein